LKPRNLFGMSLKIFRGSSVPRVYRRKKRDEAGSASEQNKALICQLAEMLSKIEGLTEVSKVGE
jgi:hypothetical protein